MRGEELGLGQAVLKIRDPKLEFRSAPGAPHIAKGVISQQLRLEVALLVFGWLELGIAFPANRRRRAHDQARAALDLFRSAKRFEFAAGSHTLTPGNDEC